MDKFSHKLAVMSELTDKAQTLLAGRITSIERLEQTTARVATAKEQLRDAERGAQEAWSAAITAGWTDAELRQLGLSKVAKRGRPAGSRNKRKTTAAPASKSSDLADAAN